VTWESRCETEGSLRLGPITELLEDPGRRPARAREEASGSQVRGETGCRRQARMAVTLERGVGLWRIRG
jgi:hypothetical protein